MPLSTITNSNKENINPNAHPVRPSEIPVYNKHTDTFKLNPRQYYDHLMVNYNLPSPVLRPKPTPISPSASVKHPILPVSAKPVKVAQQLLNFSMFRASMRDILEAAFSPSNYTKDLSNQDSASMPSCGINSLGKD